MGGPYEGLPSPVSIDKNAEWRISDDTQLTLATCEAITEVGFVDAQTIATRMAAWFAEGRVTGIGASTYAALNGLLQGGHWALVGMRGEQAAGNGAAMRIAPLAFYFDPANSTDRRTIRDVCRITHHNDEAYAGALAILAAIRFAWMDKWINTPSLFDRIVELLPDSCVRDRLVEFRGLDPDDSLSDIAKRYGNSGYVVHSVPLALAGAQQVQMVGFQEMLEQIIAAGGDTDTIASMAGQIAGTLLGYEALPSWMLERLPDRETIYSIAWKYSEIVSVEQ